MFLDTTLHKKDATGITLSNLFRQWPIDSLYMIGDAERVAISTTEGYKNTFTLGNDEFKHAFPFGILKSMLYFIREYKQKITRNQISTSQNIAAIVNNNIEKPNDGIGNLTTGLVERLFFRLGLNHLLFRCKISDRLDKWITESNPDFFYTLLSTRHSILFAKDIVTKYNKPLIIHIMDDWPATIGNDTFAPRFWNRFINIEFIRLLGLAKKKIAISQFMAEEYKKRFGDDWGYFHNPIIISDWVKYQKNYISIKKYPLKIGYFGRIGRANKQSIQLFIDAVSSGKIDTPVELHLFTNFTSHNYNLENIIFHPFLDNSLMPVTITSFDFLLLPISFNDEDVSFAKYSMPTKLSEYLISGVPVIVLAPNTIAISNFFSKNNCGFCINTFNVNEIAQKLNEFIADTSIQNIYARNGKAVAFNDFEMSTVGKRFSGIFEN